MLSSIPSIDRYSGCRKFVIALDRMNPNYKTNNWNKIMKMDCGFSFQTDHRPRPREEQDMARQANDGGLAQGAVDMSAENFVYSSVLQDSLSRSDVGIFTLVQCPKIDEILMNWSYAANSLYPSPIWKISKHNKFRVDLLSILVLLQ